jgi:hypothetical protein
MNINLVLFRYYIQKDSAGVVGPGSTQSLLRIGADDVSILFVVVFTEANFSAILEGSRKESFIFALHRGEV